MLISGSNPTTMSKTKSFYAQAHCKNLFLFNFVVGRINIRNNFNNLNSRMKIAFFLFIYAFVLLLPGKDMTFPRITCLFERKKNFMH
jgi:hypothetical protein